MIDRHLLISWHPIWLDYPAMAIKNAWKIDPSQSKIAFKVGYMQLGVITGEFRLFNGFVECDDAFEELDRKSVV